MPALPPLGVFGLRTAKRLLLTWAVVAVLGGCAREANPAKRLDCPPVQGIEPLLARPKGDLIILDGDGAVDAASQAIGCLAAARGERVIWGATRAAAARLVRPVRALGSRGALVDIFHFDPAPEGGERAAGDARSEAFARSVAVVQGLKPDRLILVVDPPDAARAPVGLSGNTWRPLGARLPLAHTISLRAERSLNPGIRVRLVSFEDVPERGAALQYDGVVEVGPQTQHPSTTPRRGAGGD